MKEISRSKHDLIVRYIILKFQNGDWTHEMPSIGSLSMKFHVSRSYIQNIYLKFLNAGFIYSVNNKGYFINTNNKFVSKIQYINLSESEYINAPIMSHDISDIKRKVIKKFPDIFKFQNSYKLIKREDKELKISIYFNSELDPGFANKKGVLNLLMMFSYNGIALTQQTYFFQNNKQYIFLLDESKNVQLILIKSYKDNDIVGFWNNKFI